MGELIAVLSGKGGTGKTSLCAGIASALAQMGETVLCIDCDVGLRNLDISLGLADSGALSFLDVASGEYKLSQAARHPQFPALWFLTAPVNCKADDVDADAFGMLLTKARKKFKYVFLDAPAGVDAGFSLCAKYADKVILVTAADPASVRDATRAGEMLELMGKHNVRLVVNRVNEKLYKTVKITIDDIMDRAGLPLLGIVPEDEAVSLAAAKGLPLTAQTKKGAALACLHIARRLRGIKQPLLNL